MSWIDLQQTSGQIVRLTPFDRMRHHAGLQQAGAHPSIWQYILFAPADTPAGMEAHLDEIEQRRTTYREVPYTIWSQRTNQIIGMIRYLDIHPQHRALEIGTWITPAHHGDGSNVEAKFLLMEYAFESLTCIRVQFKTDATNLASQKSLLGIGATFEACLRNHLITHSGRIRSSHIYAVYAHDWPHVKERMRTRIAHKQR
ncbi:MAG: GNAT family N-acetyltransferase [Roseiflexaceae bacterium]